ncbi:hypothetical protein M422DRAFT_179211, partial [Sphaerobolus stellatus SS14]
LTILSFALLLCQVAAADKPDVKMIPFSNLPIERTYFDDSEVYIIIYHDILEGDVWISQDEGKSWDLASDVPRGKAIMFIAHPF